MTFPHTPEMLSVAERVAWFAPPEEVLRHPRVFMAHLMTYGMLEDVVYVQQQLGPEPFEQTLLNPPPGIFDERSWAYWHLMLDLPQAPTLPSRQFDQDAS